jgi:hypothetical protein
MESHGITMLGDFETDNIKAQDGTAAITLTDSTGLVTISTDLKLSAGATVDEFSTDTGMVGNSDTAVPTEKAVKTYVDDEITNHEAVTSGIHGVTGDIVGTSDTQTLTGKTINNCTLGSCTIATSLTFPDNIPAYFGSSTDSYIYHDSSHAYWDTVTGNAYIRVATSENALAAVANGAVTLYYNNSAKLATSNTGVTVTGLMNGTATAARYSDLAEKYTILGNPEIGNVILVSREEGFECEVSNEIASDRVLGVISENPGFILDYDLPDSHMIARVGKVKCWVQGPVVKGDRLVSNTEGTARKVKYDGEYEYSFAFASENIFTNDVKLIKIII